MKFAAEGTKATAIVVVFAVATGIVGAIAVGSAAGWAAFLSMGLVAAAVLLFFRDPERVPPADPSAVVSPADGRVVFAAAGAAGHRFSGSSTTKVAIFMSPLDVHVNRSPVEGVVEKVEHRPGRFAAAYREDAGDINESSSMLMRTVGGAEVVVVQIAGWLARRIICRASPAQRLARGDRFGLIMFGSRVDVYLPPQARLTVAAGDRVWAGRSVLAHLDSEGGSDGRGAA